MGRVGLDAGLEAVTDPGRSPELELAELLAALESDAMRKELESKRPELALKILRHFHASTPGGQVAIVRIFEHGGAEMIRSVMNQWRFN